MIGLARVGAVVLIGAAFSVGLVGNATAEVGRVLPRLDRAWQVDRALDAAHDYWQAHVGSDLPACGQPTFAWATARGMRAAFPDLIAAGDGEPQGFADLTGCRIVISRAGFGFDPTGEPSERFDRQGFCRLVVHEYGHLVGVDHDAPFMVMRDSNLARIKQCRRWWR